MTAEDHPAPAEAPKTPAELDQAELNAVAGGVLSISNNQAALMAQYALSQSALNVAGQANGAASGHSVNPVAP